MNLISVSDLLSRTIFELQRVVERTDLDPKMIAYNQKILDKLLEIQAMSRDPNEISIDPGDW